MYRLNVVIDYRPLGFIAGIVQEIHTYGMTLAPLPVRIVVGTAVGVVVVQGGRVLARLDAHVVVDTRGVGLAVVAEDAVAWREVRAGCAQPAQSVMPCCGRASLPRAAIHGEVRRMRAVSTLRL